MKKTAVHRTKKVVVNPNFISENNTLIQFLPQIRCMTLWQNISSIMDGLLQ